MLFQILISMLMKKILLLVYGLMSSSLFAQDLFVLEKTLEGYFSFNPSSYTDENYISLSTSAQTDIFYSSTLQGNSIIYRTYDIDYNPTTEIYTFDIPTGYTIVSCQQIELPNETESEVFVVTMMNSSSYGAENYYRMIAYDRKGKSIFEFKSASASSSIYPVLYKIKNKYKLIVYRYNLVNNQLVQLTDVYTLNTTSEENSINRTRGNSQSSQIFDIRGNLIYEVPKEELNHITLPQGLYIQKDENSNTRKFLIE